MIEIDIAQLEAVEGGGGAPMLPKPVFGKYPFGPRPGWTIETKTIGPDTYLRAVSPKGVKNPWPSTAM
jgi:hypothetical protein